MPATDVEAVLVKLEPGDSYARPISNLVASALDIDRTQCIVVIKDHRADRTLASIWITPCRNAETVVGRANALIQVLSGDGVDPRSINWTQQISTWRRRIEAADRRAR